MHAAVSFWPNLGMELFQRSAWLILLVCVFVPLERLLALHPVKVLRKQVAIDAAWYFINTIIPASIIAVPLVLLAHCLQGLDPGGLYSAVADWPLWARILAALLVTDFGFYWAHRAMHTSPYLWRLHTIHHSPEELDWLVNTRAHPFEIVFTRMCSLVPAYLLGFVRPLAGKLDPVVAWVVILGTLWTFFIHANIRLRLGPLERLISTPMFHHWHHTRDKNRGHNFAAMFPIFDQVFGTAWFPDSWPTVYGIPGKVSPTLTGQLTDPFLEPRMCEGPDSGEESSSRY